MNRSPIPLIPGHPDEELDTHTAMIKKLIGLVTLMDIMRIIIMDTL